MKAGKWYMKYVYSRVVLYPTGRTEFGCFVRNLSSDNLHKSETNRQRNRNDR